MRAPKPRPSCPGHRRASTPQRQTQCHGMPDAAPPLLEMTGITKSFGGVQALKGVDFALQAGEIHGLVGENGAGKSTLMKIIAGVHSGYGGRMAIDGREVNFRSARDALAAGIGMVHQELSIVPDLSRRRERVPRQAADRRARRGAMARHGRRRRGEQLQQLGLDVDPRTRIGALPIGLQQLIELARVLFSGARIIILDEPTSALSPPEVEQLFGVLRSVKASGRSVIFISHFLDDILRISDAVTVFRNGRKVADVGRGADRQALGHRTDDRQGSRRAGGELHRRHSARRQAPGAGGDGGAQPHRQPVVPRPVLRHPGRRDPRDLRLHGLRSDRACSDAVRQDRARCRHADGRGCAAPVCSTRQRRRTPAWRSCPKAGARCCSTTNRSTRTPRFRSSSASPSSG